MQSSFFLFGHLVMCELYLVKAGVLGPSVLHNFTSTPQSRLFYKSMPTQKLAVMHNGES